MKTKSQILKEVEIRCNATIFESTLSVCVVAMQEHTDQAIAEYKRKLKEAVINDDIGFVALRIIELIDTTTI